MTHCPRCNHNNPEGAANCARCHAALPIALKTLEVVSPFLVEERPAYDLRFGETSFQLDMVLSLYFERLKQAVDVDLHATGPVVLGRADPNRLCTFPCVDLTLYGAQMLGVSRQHARLELDEGGTLYLCDLDTTNGTWINRRRLVPNLPRVLRDGDEVVLGRMQVYTLYKVRL